MIQMPALAKSYNAFSKNQLVTLSTLGSEQSIEVTMTVDVVILGDEVLGDIGFFQGPHRRCPVR